AMGHPIIGDPVYGRRRTASTVPALRKILKQARRQMLHAAHLRFTHPTTGAALEFDASLPEDMSAVLTSLRTIP
ncbi:MAG: RluA family pseudouridine synthase, partial [Desulfatitalea sp.]|nr:hypothetical protein [Desulfatitalea sp.]NNK00802.1 RluA family pseudouridine synthase [Desulfatitalea sp.]